MLPDLLCLKNDVIVSVDSLNNVSDTIEYLIIGNDCLNELNEIDFSRFGNVRMSDVGCNALRNVKNVMISSMMIDD